MFNKNHISVLILILYIVVVFTAYPYILSLLFITSTLTVASISLFSGIRGAIYALFVTTICILMLYVGVDITLPEFLIRYLGFFVTVTILSFLSSSLKNSKEKSEKLQEDLKASDEKYKSFIQNSSEGIWRIELKKPLDIKKPINEQIDWIYEYSYLAECNDAMAKMYGYKNSAFLLGKSINFLMPRSEINELYLRAFIENNYIIEDVESEEVGSEGQTLYFQNTLIGVIEEESLLRGWGVQRDLTHQKKQASEIEKSQERYKAFIETSEEAIWRVEFKTPIPTSLSPKEQAQRFFKDGYIAESNKKPILAFDNLDVVVDQPLENVGKRTSNDDWFMEEFVKNNYAIYNYESVDNSKGYPIHLSTTMTGTIKNGFWLRAWVVQRDITKEKEYSGNMENLLREAQKAKEGLEVANAEKDRFLANLSHELRTPLVSILGYSSMLLELETTPEDAERMLRVINKNAKLQVQLIEDLLDLSRIISGKIELSRTYFDVTELMNDSVDILKTQAEIKNLKIIENYKNCHYFGDKKRLTQVVLNLLSNAIKFTEEGTITIAYTCDKKNLTMSVKDSGIGIADKNLDLLFQPFKQIDSSSTRAKMGLGLGLSIVKNLVNLHHGEVSVISKLGEGSEFIVTLPMIDEFEEDETPVKPVKTGNLTGVSILLVEDDTETAEFIKNFYKTKKAQVIWASNTKVAREEIKNHQFDLYVFDLSMPGEDGISLIKSIRKEGDNTKAVALTAFADVEHEREALQSGFDMFLKKPCSLEDLISVGSLLTKK